MVIRHFSIICQDGVNHDWQFLGMGFVEILSSLSNEKELGMNGIGGWADEHNFQSTRQVKGG